MGLKRVLEGNVKKANAGSFTSLRMTTEMQILGPLHFGPAGLRSR